MERIQSITILARRWFDKINGNTYHSVRVLINGKEVVNVPHRYGYGEMYLQTAKEELEEKGVITFEKHQDIYSYCKNNKIEYYVDVVDVGRKKDL